MNRYVNAEITSGGNESVKKKLKQLENDTIVAMRKRKVGSVLDAVTLAAVVNHMSKAKIVCSELHLNNDQYPNLFILAENRRLVFIQDTRTPLVSERT
jgi:hypothetical protein